MKKLESYRYKKVLHRALAIDTVGLLMPTVVKNLDLGYVGILLLLQRPRKPQWHDIVRLLLPAAVMKSLIKVVTESNCR